MGSVDPATVTDIWYALPDKNKFLYHYTSAHALTDHILPSGRLRFSKFANLNDPREAINWQFVFAGFTTETPRDLASIAHSLNQHLKHRWRVGCFVCDSEEAVQFFPNYIDDPNSFSASYERGHSRPRMWAHYAENHAGACLVFSRAALSKAVEAAVPREARAICAQVEYGNTDIGAIIGAKNAHVTINLVELKKHGADAVTQLHANRHHKRLFFLKSRDWETEREFRWVIGPTDEADIYIDIRDSLVGILLGERFPTSARWMIERSMFTEKITLASIRWQNGFPQIEALFPGFFPHPYEDLAADI